MIAAVARMGGPYRCSRVPTVDFSWPLRYPRVALGGLPYTTRLQPSPVRDLLGRALPSPTVAADCNRYVCKLRAKLSPGAVDVRIPRCNIGAFNPWLAGAAWAGGLLWKAYALRAPSRRCWCGLSHCSDAAYPGRLNATTPQAVCMTDCNLRRTPLGHLAFLL